VQQDELERAKEPVDSTSRRTASEYMSLVDLYRSRYGTRLKALLTTMIMAMRMIRIIHYDSVSNMVDSFRMFIKKNTYLIVLLSCIMRVAVLSNPMHESVTEMPYSSGFFRTDWDPSLIKLSIINPRMDGCLALLK